MTLIGISAQNYPTELRAALWQRLATDLKPDFLLNMYQEITLEELLGAIQLIFSGKLKGRTIVKLAV